MNIKLRTKRKIKKGAQGSITLFMVLILLPTMVFGGVIVDTARMSMCKSAVSGAGDLAMNSQLANYDTVLKDVYGLFASSQLKTDEQITQDVTRYFEDTLVSYGVVSEEDAGSYVETLLGDLRNNLFGENTDDVSNFLNMDITNVTVKPVEDSALNNPDILRNQIVEYMKYRAPIEFGMGFFDSLKTFASLKTQSEVIDKKVKTEESTQDLTKKMEAAIKSIRAYDKKFDEFTFTNSLDNNHTTYVYKGSPEFDYDHTLLRLKDKGSENYKNINRLTLIFLIKRLSADDAYLYNTNKKLIDKNNNNDYYVRSGLYTPGSYNLVNENDKEASLQSIISTLNSMNYSYKTKFATNHVQDNKINNVSNASKQYANFRAEALNEDGIRKVINLLEQARYCWSSVGSELEQAKQDKQQAQTNMATYKQNVENAEGDYSDSIDTINSNDRSVDNLNTPLITDVRENGITFTVEPNYNQKISKYKQHFNSHFGVNYDNCNGNTGSNKYWVSYLNHQADGVNSQEANYIDCQSTNVGVLYSNLYDIISNVEKYNAEKQKYDAADATVTALEAKKTAYNNVLKKYEKAVNTYQNDITIVKDYIKAAENTVKTMSTDIKNQYDDIYNNVKELKKMSKDIEDKLADVVTAIETYEQNLDAWENSNNNNKSNNPDSFYSTNQSDIESAKKNYDKDSVKKLKDMVVLKTKALQNFMTEMDNGAKFKYGDKKINKLSSANAVVNAAKSVVEVKFYTYDEAEAKLDTLYKAPGSIPSPTGVNDADTAATAADKMPNLHKSKQFLKDGIYGRSTFLSYLDATFPEQPDNDPDNQEAEEAYDELKDNGDKNSNNTAVKDEEDGGNGGNGGNGGERTAGKYGYMFKTSKITDFADSLPSVQASAAKQSVENDNDTVKNNGDSVNVSDNVSQQSSIVNTLFANIGKALKNGRDNAYVMQYLFDNFSYNTCIQDRVVEQTGVSTYAEASANVADADKVKKAQESLFTTSNYLINGDNNYAYGAELEYILYGNQDFSKNVTYAKTSIYAVRFMFNVIFAFTDTDIRNTTRSIGMAVQAATCGIVPYQVVQVVAQLALAAAESAIDLQNMNVGLKVPIVKTSDTWTLSVKGLTQNISNTVKSYAVTAAKNVASTVIDTVTEKIHNSINDLSNVTQDNLSEYINQLGEDIQSVTVAKGEEMFDTYFAKFQNKLDDKINELKYMSFENADAAEAAISQKLDEIIADAANFDTGIEGCDDIKNALKDEATSKMKGWLQDIKSDLTGKIEAGCNNITGKIIELGNSAKEKLMNKVNDYMRNITNTVTAKLQDITDSIVSDLTSCAHDGIDQAKEKLTNKVNSYLDSKLGENKVNQSVKTNQGTNSTGKKGKSVASAIKFGYKDYLMLFMYINICANGDNILNRTGDVIQMNISQAGDASNLKHQKGKDFKLSNACTYVSVEADVKADMLFMNMDFFKENLETFGGVVETDSEGNGLEKITTFKYKGLYGY